MHHDLRFEDPYWTLCSAGETKPGEELTVQTDDGNYAFIVTKHYANDEVMQVWLAPDHDSDENGSDDDL